MNSFRITYLTKDIKLIQQVESFLSLWNDKCENIEVKTSGSTGIPKKIILQKSFMEQSARMTGRFFNFTSNQRILLALSPETIGGRMLIVRAIIHQMELVVVDVTRNPLLALEQDIDFAALVPMQVTSILKENAAKLDRIKILLIGGAHVDLTLIESLKNYKGQAFESFGMTETMSHIAVKQLTPEYSSFFQVLPGVKISENDRCLRIDAPQIGVHQLQTNDEVKLLNATQFEWKGRKDFVVNSGGIKLHPEQIEQKIKPFIADRFFLIGVSDSLLGQKLILFIESMEFDTKQLIENFKLVLTSYEVPKEIYFCASFVETISGKIDRIITCKQLLN